MAEIAEEDRVYIREAAERLDRRIGTLRKWDREEILPVKLRPKRGKQGWRYWSEDQIEGVIAWMRKLDMRPGKGLPYYKPSEDEISEQLEKLRKPRTKKEDQESVRDAA